MPLNKREFMTKFVGRKKIYKTASEKMKAMRRRKELGDMARVYIFPKERYLESRDIKEIDGETNTLSGIINMLDFMKLKVISYSAYGNRKEEVLVLKYLKQRTDIEKIYM